MTTPKLYTSEQLPTSSEEAIRRFDEKYLAVISAERPSDWASRFVYGVDAPRTTYPMSFLATKFRETREESGRYTDMGDKTFDLKVAEFDTGYEAKVFDLLTNVFAWKRWGDVPSEFAIAEERHYARELAAAFEAGETGTSPYDDVAFFHATDHLANPMKGSGGGTWGNYQASIKAPTLANIQAEMILMQGGVKDQNGDKMIVEPDEIWLPTARYQSTSDLLNQAFLATGESNYMVGKLKAVHAPEFTDANDWYLVDSKLIKRGFDPMIAAKYSALDGQLGLRFLDQSSDHFKRTGKIAVSQHIWCGFALLFPHCVRKVNGA